MKILAIGNSFSQDSSRYLHNVAESAGVDLTVVNLYIGGCSLEMHAQNINGDIAAYDYELNGSEALKKISIKDALLSDEWDVVTLQQASHYSGIPDTYEPFGSVVIDQIKKYAPNAKIYFHMTWAYEKDSNHPLFTLYLGQSGMYDRILGASQGFAKTHGIGFIPVGKVIQALRAIPPFDYPEGISLCRDGFHLSLTYGRYAAAATWMEVLCGKLADASYIPPETTPEYIGIINKTVISTVK